MSPLIPPADTTALSAGLLIARLVLGFLILGHGAQKLLGWFGGYGLAGTAGFFESLGFRPGRLFVAAAGAAELTSGGFLILGLLGPIGPALLLSTMIVAVVSVWKNGVFAQSNGIELPLLFAAGGLALALTGPGRFSLDALGGLDRLWTPGVEWAAVGVGILLAIVNLAARQPVPVASSREARS